MTANMFDQTKKNSLTLFFVIVGSLITLGLLEDYLSFLQSIDNEFSFLDFVLASRDSTDSWWPMYEAAFNSFGERERSIYAEIFFEEGIKFQYPPISLLPFMLFIKFNVSLDDIVYFLNTASFWAIFIIVWSGYFLARKVLAEINEGHSSISRTNRLFLFLLLFVGTYTFYPIIWAQHLGQVQVFIDLFICLGLLAWLGKYKFISGMLIALAALVKPQFGLVLIWGLLRKEKEYSIGMLVILIPAGILSLAVFGLQEHLDYLRVLSFIGKHGEVFWANQSLNGLLNRMLSDVDSLTWQFHSFAPYNIVVHVATLASTVGFILLGLFFRPGWIKKGNSGSRKSLESLLDLSTVLIAITIGSPIAWEHHYGIFWPIFIIAFVISIHLMKIKTGRGSVFTVAILSLSYMLISNYFYFAEETEFAVWPLNFLQSYIYVGGLLLLTAILHLRFSVGIPIAYLPSRNDATKS